MGVKNTTIGQVLSLGALALIGRQAYRYYNARGKSKQDFMNQDSKLDRMLEDTFPASDPMPYSHGSASGVH